MWGVVTKLYLSIYDFQVMSCWVCVGRCIWSMTKHQIDWDNFKIFLKITRYQGFFFSCLSVLCMSSFIYFSRINFNSSSLFFSPWSASMYGVSCIFSLFLNFIVLCGSLCILLLWSQTYHQRKIRPMTE